MVSRYDEHPRMDLDDEQVSARLWQAYGRGRRLPAGVPAEVVEAAIVDDLADLGRLDLLRVCARSVRLSCELGNTAARHRPLAPLDEKQAAIAVLTLALDPEGQDTEVLAALLADTPAFSWPKLIGHMVVMLPVLAHRDALPRLAAIAHVVASGRGEGGDGGDPA